MSDRFRATLRLPAIQLAPLFAVGMILAYYCDIPLRMCLLTAAAVAALIVFITQREFRIVGIGLFAGAALMSGYLTYFVQPMYSLDGQTAYIVCRVSEAEPRGSDITLCTVSFMHDGVRCRASMYLSQNVGVGDEISAEVQLAAYEGNSYMFSQGILFSAQPVGYCKVKKAAPSLEHAISDYRAELITSLRSYIADDEGALAAAMLFGDKSSISAELKRSCRVSGVLHLTVVSGMHFMLCITVLLFLLKGSHRILRASAALLIIPFAVLFFGESQSVIRAAVMLAISQLAVVGAQKSILLNTICSAYLVIVLFSPNAALDCGLMMSFMGVFGAGVLAPRVCGRLFSQLCVKKRLRPLADYFMVSLCAFACTAPVCIALYGGISMAGALATVLVMPFFTVAVLFGVIFALTGGAAAFAVPIGLMMKPIAWLINSLGGTNELWLTLDFFGAWIIAAAAVVFLAIYAVLPQYNGAALACVACALSLVVLGSTLGSARRCIAFVSDGNSGAAVICSGMEATVMISGSGGGLDDDIADTLTQYGITHLRAVVAQDCDYMGAVSVNRLCSLYGDTCEVYIPPEYSKQLNCGTVEVITDSINHIEIFGLTISTAQVGSNEKADIVLYSGYKYTAPETNAAVAVYVSSRQSVLPENGVNVSRSSYVYVP